MLTLFNESGLAALASPLIRNSAVRALCERRLRTVFWLGLPVYAGLALTLLAGGWCHVAREYLCNLFHSQSSRVSAEKNPERSDSYAAASSRAAARSRRLSVTWLTNCSVSLPLLPRIAFETQPIVPLANVNTPEGSERRTIIECVFRLPQVAGEFASTCTRLLRTTSLSISVAMMPLNVCPLRTPVPSNTHEVGSEIVKLPFAGKQLYVTAVSSESDCPTSRKRSEEHTSEL